MKLLINALSLCIRFPHLKQNLFYLPRNELFRCYSEQSFLKEKYVQNYLNSVCNKPETILQSYKSSRKEHIRHIINARLDLLSNLTDLEELKNYSKEDANLKETIAQEFSLYYDKLSLLDEELFQSLLPDDAYSECNEVVIEVIPGAGGQEAMLFARDIFNMYSQYAEYKGWALIVAEDDKMELGGLKKGSLIVEGAEACNRLQFESGVHRVQRVPSTEKSGRIHTSTVAVAVLPQPNEIDIQLNDKDLLIETSRSSGAGGQHVNTTDSAVRIVHVPTGLAVECQTERSQIKNRAIAIKRLKAKMYQLQYESVTSEIKSMRKSQVGTLSRSEKIRTYNFNQDRITDHRLSINLHNIEGFLSGSEQLDDLVDELLKFSYQKKIKIFLDEINSKSHSL